MNDYLGRVEIDGKQYDISVDSEAENYAGPNVRPGATSEGPAGLSYNTTLIAEEVE